MVVKPPPLRGKGLARAQHSPPCANRVTCRLKGVVFNILPFGGQILDCSTYSVSVLLVSLPVLSHPHGSTYPLGGFVFINPTRRGTRPTGCLNFLVLQSPDRWDGWMYAWLHDCMPSFHTFFFCPGLLLTDLWREPSRQTSVRWSRCRNASSCKNPRKFKPYNFWNSAQVSKPFTIPCFVFPFPRLSTPSETETARFSEAIKALSAKTNPLADIGEHLRKRMRREEEQGQSWCLAENPWHPSTYNWNSTRSLGPGVSSSFRKSVSPQLTRLSRLTPPHPRTKMIGTKRGGKWFCCCVDIPRCLTPRLYCLLMHLLY